MRDDKLLRLAKLPRSKLLAKLAELESTRRVLVSLIRSSPRPKRKGATRAS